MKKVKTLTAWFLSFLFIVSLFVTLLIINISNFFTVESMKRTVLNINISHEINKIQNSSPTSENKAEVSDIINMAYEEADKHAIPSALVDEIFNSKEVKNFLGQIIGNSTDNIINGKEIQPVTSEDFNKLLDDNIDKWIKQSKVDISDSKKEVLLIRMKSTGAGIIDNLPSSKTIDNKLNDKTKNGIQFIFSNLLKTILIIHCLVCIFLIYILKRKNALWILYIATSLLITGLSTIVVSLTISDILTYVFSQYNLSFILTTFSSALARQIFTTGLIVIIMSIVLYIIFNYKNKSKSFI